MLHINGVVVVLDKNEPEDEDGLCEVDSLEESVRPIDDVLAFQGDAPEAIRSNRNPEDRRYCLRTPR